jgi:uncharacterized membrane protein YfcA
VTIALIVIVAVVVGMLGSMLGVGGGLLIVPLLTLVFDVPVTKAIGTSLVCVVVTSSASQVVYAGRHITHPRLGMALEIMTTVGALVGALTALVVDRRAIFLTFAAVLVYLAWSMGRTPADRSSEDGEGVLPASFVDPADGTTHAYRVHNMPAGVAISGVAGVVSGLLGVGGGVIKVPMMSLLMNVPLKAAIATSNLMIGVTAATGALLFFSRGYVEPRFAVPTAIGVVVGAQLGSRLAGRAPVSVLRRLFQVLAIILAVQMAWKGLA